MEEQAGEPMERREYLPIYSVLERVRELRARSKMLCHRADKQRWKLRRLSEKYWSNYG